MWRFTTLLITLAVIPAFLGNLSHGRGSSTSINPGTVSTITAKPGPGMFLVAGRALNDPNFGQSVVLLVEHDDSGSFGLIVNRPGSLRLSEAIPDLDDQEAEAHSLYFGGPVGLQLMHMLLRNESRTPEMSAVVDDVYISADRRLLNQLLATGKPASDLHFFIGYSGWGAGQLDSELGRGDWHVIKADAESIFTGEPEQLWQKLIEQLEPSGIQVNHIPLLKQVDSGNPVHGST